MVTRGFTVFWQQVGPVCNVTPLLFKIRDYVIWDGFISTIFHRSTTRFDFIYFFDDWNYGYVHLRAKICVLKRLYNKLVKRV